MGVAGAGGGCGVKTSKYTVMRISRRKCRLLGMRAKTTKPVHAYLGTPFRLRPQDLPHKPKISSQVPRPDTPTLKQTAKPLGELSRILLLLLPRAFCLASVCDKKKRLQDKTGKRMNTDAGKGEDHKRAGSGRSDPTQGPLKLTSANMGARGRCTRPAFDLAERKGKQRKCYKKKKSSQQIHGADQQIQRLA